jgi:SAM-dependent methyltransferase
MIRGNSGCEIGGPSFDFSSRGAIPLYPYAARIDNFQYSEKTLRATFKDGEPFRFHRRRAPGTLFIREAHDLGVPAGTYDFVISSHVLEHCANPIKVLKEWCRAARPGASFVINVPYHKWQFDHRRPPTPIAHMVEDYACDVGEDDMTHFSEIVELHDHPFDDPAAEPLDVYVAHSRDNFVYRELHHHVFDKVNFRQLLEAAGLLVLAIEYVKPRHIMSLSTWAG